MKVDKIFEEHCRYKYSGGSNKNASRTVGTYKKTPAKAFRHLKRLTIFVAVFSLLSYASFAIIRSVNPTIVSLSEAKIRSLTVSAINNAIFDVMTDSIKYSDLMTVEKDAAGNVTILEANSLLINRLARDTASKAEQNLERIGEQIISIPLGQLTGTPLLADIGPKIDIYVIPMGSVLCQFLSEFEEAGINQTRHKIYLDVLTTVNVIMPTADTIVETVTEVLVSESIIIGKVPDTYLSGLTLGDPQSVT